MQAASATLDPPNLWTFQASTAELAPWRPPTGSLRSVAAWRWPDAARARKIPATGLPAGG